MALGADDVETAGSNGGIMALLPLGLNLFGHGGVGMRQILFQTTAQHDVRTTTGHVGGDGDRSRPTGLGDDVGFLLMMLGIEHLMRHTGLAQDAGQQFRVLDRRGADQHRLAMFDAILDVLDDRGEFLPGGQIDQIPMSFRIIGRFGGIMTTSRP